MVKNSVKALVLATVCAGASVCVHAASTYTFNNSSASNYNVKTQGAGATDPLMTGMQGFSAANGGTTSSPSGFASSTTKWTAFTGTYGYWTDSGIGMNTDGNVSPNHAIDNGPQTNSSGTATGPGRTEAVLLTFADSVVLNSVDFGWMSGDADFSVFRYVGNAANPTPTLGANQTNAQGFATLAGTIPTGQSGWELVGNYGDIAASGQAGYKQNPDALDVNDAGLSSSWWLISAYNSTYSNSAKNSGVLGQGNDYFKLYAVGATKAGCTTNCGGNEVPEPGSLALVSLGMIGIVAQMRRRRALRSA